MREVSNTSAFKRNVKLLSRRGWNLAQLWAVVGKLAVDVPTDQLFKDHPLSGPLVGKRECHVTNITDDWVLIYQKVDADRLILIGTGTHADVFGE